jgi:hypothetical protein
MHKLLFCRVIGLLGAACCNMLIAAEPTKEVVLASEINWQQLNPARGDKSPQAGTLWGDRQGAVPTGFLAKFVDGFSSPPHIHNVTYRAVVISGYIHNDDPNAADMWRPPGSFWTQPKGEVHITSAKGDTSIALVEIDKGPYLVLPVGKAFDSGERPINVDASNIVWIDPPGGSTLPSGPKVAYLWGSLQNGQANGTYVKLPVGFEGRIVSRGSLFRAVVIKGDPHYQVSKIKMQRMEPGSYFSSKGAAADHALSIVGDESIIYIHTNGNYQIVPKVSS